MKTRTSRTKSVVTLVLAIVTVLAVTTMPGWAGKGNGKALGNANTSSSATCWVDGNVVHATGLPADEVINFMVTDESGTDGWALGTTSEGWWDVDVPDRVSWTTYEFVSRTWGPNGTKYEIFTSCSAGV